MNFFKTKPRTPPDVVRGLREAVNRLESTPGGEAKRKVGRTKTMNLKTITVIIDNHLHLLRPTKMYPRICSISKASCPAMAVCWISWFLSYPTVTWLGEIRAGTRTYRPTGTGNLQHRLTLCPSPEHLTVRIRGEKGRCSNLQQSSSTTDWYTMANCWISFWEARCDLRCACWLWEWGGGIEHRHDLERDVETWAALQDPAIFWSVSSSLLVS